MYDVKAADNKHNLLMYVVSEVKKKVKNSIIDDEKDIEKYEELAKIAVSQLYADMNEIKKGLNILNKAILS